ncbi:putative F-box protein At1g26515 isoform X2 [Euphorbia lathyris]|uniref:putative F-box protein At1g26515 isoform X2 n=1 Tax=Euphorbia lathyris TaxID=212925 RepID=UPI00331398FB
MYGLLCLSNPSGNDPVIVCNPVTGEFINLPEVRTVKHLNMPLECGFGFSPMTNQYKVIRMFTRWIEHEKFMAAEVHVLGTKTWKDLGFFPSQQRKFSLLILMGSESFNESVEQMRRAEAAQRGES